MHTIEAILFDYGLVLSAPPVPAAWERMKTITGQDEPTFHAGYWAHRHAYDRGTHTGVEFWHRVAGHSGVTLNEWQVSGLLTADIDLWGDLNEPMMTWVHSLHRAGIRTGILSNMGDAMADGLLAKYQWLANFDHKTWSYTLKLAKPELAIYRAAAEGLKTAPENILFIDDKQENITAALESGMQAIRYTTHEAFEHEMTTRGLGNLLTR